MYHILANHCREIFNCSPCTFHPTTWILYDTRQLFMLGKSKNGKLEEPIDRRCIEKTVNAMISVGAALDDATALAPTLAVDDKCTQDF
jgi:hypothetical protein